MRNGQWNDCHKTLLLKAATSDSGLRHDKQRTPQSYLRALCWCLCPSYWTPHDHDWPPSLLLSSPCFPLSLRVLLLSQGSAFSPQSPRSSEVIKNEVDYQICIVIKIYWLYNVHMNMGRTCLDWLTVSEVLSSRKLMALFTSSLQSWRATMHSSWVFPVTSISCENANQKHKALNTIMIRNEGQGVREPRKVCWSSLKLISLYKYICTNTLPV